MKTQLISGIFFLLIFSFITSCNPTGGSDPNDSTALNDSSNYWNSNTLRRQQLNGKVKAVSYSDRDEDYNEQGFITKSIITLAYGTKTTMYTYATTGELTGTSINSIATTYAYQSMGKYVVAKPYDLLTGGLVPNLKSYTTLDGGADYSLQADNMTLITSSNGGANKDTTTIKYSGKYPVSITNKTGFTKNMTYAANGMFLTFTQGAQSTGSSNENRYYFKPDNRFQLIDSIGHYVTESSVTTHTVEKYTYDANKNILTKEDANFNYQYNYTYDSHNNWTSKTTKSKTKGAINWGTPTTEIRVITYWP